MIFNPIEILVLISINSLSVFFIIIVLANRSHEKVYRWFVIMTIFLMGWVDFAYLGYWEPDITIATISYRINGAFVAAFLFAIYVFYVESFLKINHRIFKNVLLLVSSTFVFLELFTNTLIQGVVRREWGNEIIFGPANDFFNSYALLVTGVLIYYFISRYFKLPAVERKKVIFFLIGTFFLIIFNLIFNVLSPLLLGTAQYQHLGDYSAVIFLAFTAFAMLRHKFLDVKVALTAFLISAIGIFLLIDVLFLANDIIEQAMKLVIFIFFITISIILVRSVLLEIKQREELERVNGELEDALKKEKDMMDILGHELRTPLTIARNAILMIDMEMKKNDPNMDLVKELLEKSKENIKREVSTLQTVLSTTRLENDKAQINYVAVDVKDVVSDSIDALKNEAEKKGLTINISLPKEQVFAWAGREQAQEIMDNLLSNAIKYTEKGHVDIKVEQDNKNVAISVADSGEGIPEKEIPNLGKKFHRVNPYTDSTNGEGDDLKIVRPGGTGIGLYVVTGFLKLMGGKLDVKSKLGEGSTFIATLPRYIDQDKNS